MGSWSGPRDGRRGQEEPVPLSHYWLCTESPSPALTSAPLSPSPAPTLVLAACSLRKASRDHRALSWTVLETALAHNQ